MHRCYNFNLKILKHYLLNVHLIRQAGNFKRSQDAVPLQPVQTICAPFWENRSELTSQEWQQLRETLSQTQKHINAQNVHAVILGVLQTPQQLPLAKNYIEDLKTKGDKPNAATLGRLLRVYNAAYQLRGSLTKQEEAEIMAINKELRAQNDILDALSCEHLIHGLVATRHWKEALQLLDMIKLSCTPTIAAYSELCKKAFKEQDLSLGMKLLHEMLCTRKQPKCELFICYLEAISNQCAVDFIYNLETLFKLLEQHELLLTERVVQTMQQICDKQQLQVLIKCTHMNNAGKCTCCGNFLNQISISDAEFIQLRNEFMQRVLLRNDVFQKSAPEEVQRFKKFIDATVPYDCVIDGLNVAYSMGNKKSPKQLANLIAAVVNYFKQRQKHVLVLGRKHMNFWPKDIMQNVRRNAKVFLTNDLTQDDPFILYATLKSGPNTDFFSRDLMRSHAYLLGTELKTIFRHWQQEHQFSLITHTRNGEIIVKEPIRHRMCAHRVQNTWHIPYKQAYESIASDSFVQPENWLCVKLTN